MKIRIGTWNIAAARKMLSTEIFDYSDGEELSYFANQLKALNLDIVCIQESHVNTHDSLAKRLASQIDMQYVAETPGCPSHIDTSYTLTTAIISRLPFESARSLPLPHPNFELKFAHNGKIVPPYNRYAQIVSFDRFTVANIHTEPLGAFGLEYEIGKGRKFAKDIEESLIPELSAPLLFAADFNMHSVSNALPNLLHTFHLQEALPNKPTKPHGTHPDHILYSPEWNPVNSDIIHTQSDHYLCWTEFEFQPTHIKQKTSNTK